MNPITDHTIGTVMGDRSGFIAGGTRKLYTEDCLRIARARWEQEEVWEAKAYGYAAWVLAREYGGAEAEIREALEAMPREEAA